MHTRAFCVGCSPIALLIGISGCTAGNERLTLGGIPGQSINPVTGIDDRGRTMTDDDAPSLGGASRMDRLAWGSVAFEVPADATLAFPHYAHHAACLDKSARQRGQFPTPMSALEGTVATPREQRYEVYAGLGYAVADAVLLVPRMFIDAPGSQVGAQAGDYERLPVSQAVFLSPPHKPSEPAPPADPARPADTAAPTPSEDAPQPQQEAAPQP
jgi:hypothetical protein